MSQMKKSLLGLAFLFAIAFVTGCSDPVAEMAKLQYTACDAK